MHAVQVQSRPYSALVYPVGLTVPPGGPAMPRRAPLNMRGSRHHWGFGSGALAGVIRAPTRITRSLPDAPIIGARGGPSQRGPEYRNPH